LHHELAKHRKIRFRRHEICELSAMPSAERSHWAWERTRRRSARVALFVAGGFAGLFALAIATGAFLVSSDWGQRTLSGQAEQSLQAIAGDRATASVGPARMALGVSHLFALRLQDVNLGNVDTKATIADIGTLDFGIRLLPLLRGDLKLGSATISDASISVVAMPEMHGADWTSALRDQRGLIDPDLVAEVAFEPLRAAFAAVDSGNLTGLSLDNITITLPEGERVRAVHILDGSLSRTGPDTLEIAAEADVDGRRITLGGTATRDVQSKRIADLDLSLIAGEPPGGLDRGKEVNAGRLGAFTINVSGGETGDQPPRLKLSAAIDKSVLDFGARGAVTGSLGVDATLAAGTNKIEIDRLLVDIGRTSLEMNGAFGPRPPTGVAGDRPVYRYELVSTNTVLAPNESPEPAMPFKAQVAGILDPESRTVSADNITIKSGPGEAVGTARLELAEGKAPGVALSFSLRDMQVAHTKQLWPWFAGARARLWALDHVFGGTVQEANLDFEVQPGRLGNGVPLSGEEVTGRFVIKDTRFDTFGKLPPVRDADGVIEVRGRDVDVALSSGTAFLPSGRSVSGTDGTLQFRATHPGIGKLAIDVQGEADAMAELATLEPINAGRFMKVPPADMAGKVTGHVIADIPVVKGIDPKSLEWDVALDYSGLSLGKPISGQLLTDADGKLTVDPSQATISASGRLNGIPATIRMVEPLRPDGPARDSDIELVLDDAARRKVAPGLDALISGTVTMRVDDADGVRRISADLGDARLDIPWIGWSKGAGVGATAEFSMRTADDFVHIEDFDLKGNSFAISGEMALSGGALQSAHFDKVRLNRGDDVNVAIARSGKGFQVNVNGRTFDARSAIKTVLSDMEGAKSAQKGSVSLRLDVDRLAGFNGEVLSGVKIDSSGSKLSLTAAADTGGAVSFSNRMEGGRKRLDMQAGDAGAVLRFLDLYKNVQGGSITVSLAGGEKGRMSGHVDARNFNVANEPRVASIVATAPAGSDRSLNQAVRKEIDTSSVQFERGYAQITKGTGYLQLANGVIRGPLIGATFQGTLYDKQGQMDMTGTFMPAYGINRIFGELPLIGGLLGNGRDRGLIGVTFKLDGAAKSPRVQVNPLSVIAPGVFRQIFEFN